MGESWVTEGSDVPSGDPRVCRPTVYSGDGPPPGTFLDSDAVEALTDLLDLLDVEWGYLGPPQHGSHRDILRRTLA